MRTRKLLSRSTEPNRACLIFSKRLAKAVTAPVLRKLACSKCKGWRCLAGQPLPEQALQGRPAEEVAVHEARSILDSAGFNARAYFRSSYLLGPAGRYRLAATSTSTYSNQFALNNGCLKPRTQGWVSTACTGWMRSL